MRNGVPKVPGGQWIKHIIGRINHPQTNGKEEGAFGTLKAKRHEFDSIDALVHWYNEVKPHMAFNGNTPSEVAVIGIGSERNRWMMLLKFSQQSNIGQVTKATEVQR